MRPATYFAIEFEAVSPPARMKARMENQLEVLAFAKANLRAGSELFVACLGNGVDYGNLIIAVDEQGAAEVRAHEHRGFIVQGVTLDDAISALKYWLPRQERSPLLGWLDE